jgi:hypothetical protein
MTKQKVSDILGERCHLDFEYLHRSMWIPRACSHQILERAVGINPAYLTRYSHSLARETFATTHKLIQ